MITKYKGTGSAGTLSWVLQRISAVALFFMVLYHFFGMITGAYNGMTSFVLGTILVFGVWHAVNGIKMITDDYVSCLKARAVLLFIYWVAGLGLFIQGLKLLSTFTF